MAKYRHRIFEMYEFLDEATEALASISARPVAEDAAPESWPFKHLKVSRSGSVTHVRFKKSRSFADEMLSEMCDDFTGLAERLSRDSKVLLDFTGVKSFNSASVDAIVLFNRRLKTRGSRLALCGLDPEVREIFFSRRSGDEPHG